MSILGNDLLLGSGDEGYNLTRSLRFRASASASLNRTPASAGNRKIWTWSGWVKLGLVSSLSTLFGTGGTTDSTRLIAQFNSTGTLNIDVYTVNLRVSNAVFRDPSAWYHIVIVFDSTNATATNRLRAYSNNVELTWSTNNAVTLNADYGINNNTSHAIGYDITNTGRYFDGYLTEVNFIDGQALTPSSFGSTNALTGVWQPARYTGTYGTNGFYLPFTDNSALTTSSNVGLGKDTSGNGNYWTTNNISITAGVTYDSMTDVPTLTSATAANYAVLNPLDKNSSITTSNANLVVASPTGFVLIRSTFFVSSGKYYWEITCDDCGGGFVGISSAAESLSSRGAETANSATINTSNGNIRTSATDSAYGSAVSDGNTMMFALDMTAGKFWAGKNGTWFNSGDPVAGTNAGKTGLTVAVSPSISLYDNEDYTANFGQRPFSYTPPTGFVALNTYNLPTSTIVKGNTVMDATLYTGNGSTQTITNAAGFKPDFVWGKMRASNGGIGEYHQLYDSIRGVEKALFSNTTDAETNMSGGGVTAFNTNGFNVSATTNGININAKTYVGWQWQAGQGTTSTNTNGTITSTVSVNASAGFSVVTYTGNGVVPGATIGHGLGVAPQFIIVKNRSTGSTDWPVYHKSIGATNWLALDTTQASAANSVIWNDTAPTSSVFSVGYSLYVNAVVNNYVAYCWTPIAGYSAFGSYTGNGSTDGPFIYTGFRPKFVLIKSTTSVNDWIIEDTARNTYNVSNSKLSPNTSGAEFTDTNAVGIDFLSNGFKIKGTDGSINTSNTYIYAAFAETPTKFALAR